ncbi:MAG: hypothetical protein IIT50_04910, partial [Bacteroidales bacterium]|nr:hypothetical protein [Bacteroidales bacterium]
HRNSDMDCLGAALGVMTCANHVGTHAYIVLDAVNTTIEDAVHTAPFWHKYQKFFINLQQNWHIKRKRYEKNNLYGRFCTSVFGSISPTDCQ